MDRAEERLEEAARKVSLRQEATWAAAITPAPVLALQEVWLSPLPGLQGSLTSPYNNPSPALFGLSQLWWIYFTCGQRGLTRAQTTAQQQHTKTNMYSPHPHTHTHTHTNICCLNQALCESMWSQRRILWNLYFCGVHLEKLQFPFNWAPRWFPNVGS